MTPLDAVRIALRAIAANRLRSALTTLGMVIGVGSVIVLIAVGQGTQKGVQDRIRGLGTDLVFVRPGVAQNSQTGARGEAGSAPTLTMDDATALGGAGIASIAGVAPQISIGGVQAIANGYNIGTTGIGTTPQYQSVRSTTLQDGAFFTDDDVTRRALVAVLGANIAQTLFPDGGAVGQNVRFSLAGGRIALNFRVVGVAAPRGGSNGGQEDGYVFVPLTAIQARLGAFVRNPTGAIFVNQINIQTTPDADQQRVIAAVTSLLSQRHGTTDTPDFQVLSQDDLIGAAGEVSRTLSILLGSIAGISLVVGGIGVMNIMLVSVTERTREIGIRRAVGARASDIVQQFVTEALTLTVGGGLLGIGAGVTTALVLNGRSVSGQVMTTVVQPWSIAIAFVVAAGIGALSGIYPAFRASTLDPIAALRNE